MTEDEVIAIVRHFTTEYLQDRLLRQLGQMVPGLDAKTQEAIPAPVWAGDLSYTLEPQEWLTMALYGAGLLDADADEMREICQSLAEWLFAIPGSSAYSIPAEWGDTEMGALWWAALIRTEGDELITLAQAAELSGISLKTLASRVDRGTLRSFTDPAAPNRQGRRLVRRSDVVISG